MSNAHSRERQATAAGERIAFLACSDCGSEQPHRVRYRNDAVAEMICTECERTIVLPRSWGQSAGSFEGSSEGAETGADYVGAEADGGGRRRRREALPALARSVGSAAVGLSLRAATKPWRVWRQVQTEGTDVLKTMPRRAATKPLRLARQLRRKVRGLL